MAAGVTREQFIRSSICQGMLEDPKLFDPDECRVRRTDVLRYAIFAMPNEEIEIRFNALLKLQKDFNVSPLEAPCLHANLQRMSPNLYSQNFRSPLPNVEIPNVEMTVEHFDKEGITKIFEQLKSGEIDYISITRDMNAPVVAGRNYPGASGGIFLRDGSYCIHSTQGRLFYELDTEQSTYCEIRSWSSKNEKKIEEGPQFTRLDTLEDGSYGIYHKQSDRYFRMFTINIVQGELPKDPGFD